MEIGPILRRDLVRVARRSSTYWGRALSALGVLAIVGACVAIWDVARLDRASVNGQLRLAMVTFGVLVGVQALGLMGMIPTLIAPAIASERERKSLDALLATRLSNAEIVLQTTVSGLLRGLSGTAVAASVLCWMSPLWGIDPRLMLLAVAGLATTAFAMAGVAAAVTVEARTAQRASATAVLVITAWLVFPVIFITTLPRIWPWSGRWLAPVLLPLLDSSPVGLLASQVGMIGRGPLLERMGWMIGLELLLGGVLIVWAVARLRRASRARYEGDTLALIRRLSRKGWWRKRPPCGDDPVLWYEIHKLRGRGRLDQLLGSAGHAALVVAYLAVIALAARPAFAELMRQGYRAEPIVAKPELHPGVRWIVVGPFSDPPPGTARAELGLVVRQLSGVFYLIYLLVTMGFAAESIVAERERDTWPGLLATPLTGPEILRAKMVAAPWRGRVYLLLTVASWVVGVAAGAIHPLGFAASLVLLASTTWYLTAIGIYASLRWPERAVAMNWAVTPVMVQSFYGFGLILLPQRGISVVMAAGATPLLGAIAPLSPADVRIAATSGAFPVLKLFGIGTGEGALAFLATYALAVVVQTAVAVSFTRAGCRNFDRLAGRPVRSAKAPSPASAPDASPEQHPAIA